jgi:hypothetical protein
MLKTLALLLALVAPASAGSYFSNTLNTTTGRQEMKISGSLCLAASSNTPNTCTILLNGTDGQITAPLAQLGHAIEDEGTGLTKRSTLNFVGDGVSVTDSGGKTVVTISGAGDLIRSTNTALGIVTTSAASWESLQGSTLTLVMDQSNYVNLDYSCNLECVDYTQCGVAFGLLVNGSHTTGQSASTTSGIMYVETSASTVGAPQPMNIHFKTRTKLAPGTHNLSMIWSSAGGVQVRMGRNMGTCPLSYEEAPDLLASGSSSAVSGATNLGAQSQAGLQGLSCSVLPCQSQGTFGSYDLWVATGTGAGQWMNSRTGVGPWD